jgi:hypothetical protein
VTERESTHVGEHLRRLSPQGVRDFLASLKSLNDLGMLNDKGVTSSAGAWRPAASSG